MTGPTILKHQIVKGKPFAASLDLQFRRVIKRIDIAKTQRGDKHDGIRQSQNLTQFLFSKAADPAQPRTFCPCCQPQILHCADCGIKVHVAVVRAPQNNRAAARGRQ